MKKLFVLFILLLGAFSFVQAQVPPVQEERVQIYVDSTDSLKEEAPVAVELPAPEPQVVYRAVLVGYSLKKSWSRWESGSVVVPYATNFHLDDNAMDALVDALIEQRLLDDPQDLIKFQRTRLFITSIDFVYNTFVNDSKGWRPKEIKADK